MLAHEIDPTSPRDALRDVRPSVRVAGQAVLATLWFGVLPGVLAVLVVRFGVPPVLVGDSVVNDAFRVAQDHPLFLGLGLFFLFAASARYWRFSLPGGHYLSSLSPEQTAKVSPAHRRAFAEAAAFARLLAAPRMRRRWVALGAEGQVELEHQLGEVNAGVDADDKERVYRSTKAARALATPLVTRAQWFDMAALAVGLAIIAGGTWLVRAKMVESYSVLSGSMLPTLQPEDRLLGNRLAYRPLVGSALPRVPRRGDIVVFKSSAVDGGHLEDTPDFLVKRVIGLPGDRISMRGGIPVINGTPVSVCDAAEYLYVNQGGDNGLSGRLLVEFLDGRAYLTVHTASSAPFTDTYEVQPGEVFVLGDNRNNSSDSRAWNNHHGGGVPLGAVEAQIQWFVAGKRADRSWDFGRFMRPVASLATQMHLDGVNAGALQAGIDACLRKRPTP